MLAYAGLRPQELRRLRWTSAKERTLVVGTPKTGRRRSVRLLEHLAVSTYGHTIDELAEAPRITADQAIATARRGVLSPSLTRTLAASLSAEALSRVEPAAVVKGRGSRG